VVQLRIYGLSSQVMEGLLLRHGSRHVHPRIAAHIERGDLLYLDPLVLGANTGTGFPFPVDGSEDSIEAPGREALVVEASAASIDKGARREALMTASRRSSQLRPSAAGIWDRGVGGQANPIYRELVAGVGSAWKLHEWRGLWGPGPGAGDAGRQRVETAGMEGPLAAPWRNRIGRTR
jgi:hypothetical protein